MTTTSRDPTRRDPARACATGSAGWPRRSTTPLLPADYLDLVGPLRSGADLRGRVVEVRPETRDAVTVVIQPGRGWRGHVPGQYVRIGVDVDGVRQWRAYSLTSPPTAPTAASRSPSRPCRTAWSATTSCAAPAPGMLVHLDQACGEFVLPDPRPARSCSSPPAAASPR